MLGLAATSVNIMAEVGIYYRPDEGLRGLILLLLVLQKLTIALTWIKFWLNKRVPFKVFAQG